jgi:hypothetical protein
MFTKLFSDTVYTGFTQKVNTFLQLCNKNNLLDKGNFCHNPNPLISAGRAMGASAAARHLRPVFPSANTVPETAGICGALRNSPRLRHGGSRPKKQTGEPASSPMERLFEREGVTHTLTHLSAYVLRAKH